MTEGHEATSIDDIVIWHAREVLPEDETITLSLEKRWIFKELVISGARSFVSGS